MNQEQMRHKLELLRNDAESLLSSWNDRERPYFVEFAGTPKSGKSTCIDTISHFFRRLDFKVLAPTEGASKRTPYYLKDNFVAFNTWSASYALTHILEGRYGSDKYHIVILDRGLFDALAWFQLLMNEGDVSNEDCDKIQRFLLVDHWRQFVDMVFLFQTDPSTSLTREEGDKLIQEPGRAMNPEFLSTLNDAYDEIETQYGKQFEPLHIVNTSADQKTSPRDTAYHVATKMIEHFKNGAG
ncbi:MAG: hypothetical protein F4X40_09515 [Chloroflexi bacterium]|nr:hypothetical protein [Chloroflexota bacterium]